MIVGQPIAYGWVVRFYFSTFFSLIHFSISFIFKFFIHFFFVFPASFFLANISGGRNTPITDIKEVKELVDNNESIKAPVQFFDREYEKGGCVLVKTDTPDKAWVIWLILGIFSFFSACEIFVSVKSFDCFLYDFSICSVSLRSLQRAWPQYWQLWAVERDGGQGEGQPQQTHSSCKAQVCTIIKRRCCVTLACFLLGFWLVSSRFFFCL